MHGNPAHTIYQIYPLATPTFEVVWKNIAQDDLIAIKDLIKGFFADKLQKKVDNAVDELRYIKEDPDDIMNDPNQ